MEADRFVVVVVVRDALLAKSLFHTTYTFLNKTIELVASLKLYLVIPHSVSQAYRHLPELILAEDRPFVVENYYIV